MRIVQITPGSGEEFYCENCLRDKGVVRAMRRAGHDAQMVPLYLPVGPDWDIQPQPLFFGGLNVYLQQKSAFFRRSPRWLDRLLDAKPLVRLAARLADMTNPRDLGQTTLSMLRGEQGRQRKELDRLADWLAGRGRPDVVILSDALLLGLARELRRRLGAPVICLLQDEDEFLEGLPEPERRQAWDLLARRAADADLFVAPSRFYAERMRGLLRLDDRRVRVVHSGVSPEDFAPAAAPPDPPAVGFLSRLCPAKGADILVEAFVRMRKAGRVGGLRLRLAGGWTGADRPYVEGLRRRLDEAGLSGDAEFLPNIARDGLADFLRSLSALSVPARRGEAFGLYVLEALACGVPVAQPRTGAFPELLEATGGGVLCEPEEPASLAEALEGLLLDPAKARELGRRGRQAVLETFNADRTAAELVKLCRSAADSRAGG